MKVCNFTLQWYTLRAAREIPDHPVNYPPTTTTVFTERKMGLSPLGATSSRDPRPGRSEPGL